MTISSLESYMNSVELSDAERKALNALISAANDWPTPVRDMQDFNEKIRIFLNKIPSKESITIGLKQNDYKRNPWQGESLYQLLEIYEFYKENLPLTNIISDLEQKISTAFGRQ